jgi:thiol-disulfide isomerase/thioredoxin
MKLLLGILFAVIALNAVAQKDTKVLITGKFSGNYIPKEIELNEVHNGDIVEHSKTRVASDGSFGFCIKPNYSGFYVIGNNSYPSVRLYVEPSKKIDITINDSTFSVNNKDIENKLLENWSNVIWELKKANLLSSGSTYIDIFPKLPELEAKKNELLTNAKTSNKIFNSLFKQLVISEYEYQLYQFLFMPRSVHPSRADFPPIYSRIASEKRFLDDSALRLDFGYRYLSIYLMFQFLHMQPEGGVKLSLEELALKHIENDILKGQFFLKNVLTRTKSYDVPYKMLLEKYRPLLVTKEQQKELADFILTINAAGTGEPGFNFDGTTPEGKVVKFSDFRGKVVVVDVWATWCGPCKTELPHLKKLKEEMIGKDVIIIGYSIDEQKNIEKWRQFVKDEGLTGVQIIGPDGFKSPVCVEYKINAIPRFMVFDKEGNIVSIDSPRPSNPELKRLIEKYL